jgi:hypothetical protein
MRVEIISDNMGFNVRLSAHDPRDFGHLLNLFKSAIADNCRRYNNKVWHVEKRAARSLETFIAMVEDAGAKVTQATQPREVVTLPAMIGDERETPAAFLTVSDEGDGGEVLEYRARCKADKRPAVIVTKHDRWASIRATVYNAAMNDKAKQIAFDYLLCGSLPGGQVRVSNRQLAASKLSFGLASEMAAWLNTQLSGPTNLVAGSLDGREHCRFEATKQIDGRIKVVQNGGARCAA